MPGRGNSPRKYLRMTLNFQEVVACFLKWSACLWPVADALTALSWLPLEFPRATCQEPGLVPFRLSLLSSQKILSRTIRITCYVVACGPRTTWRTAATAASLHRMQQPLRIDYATLWHYPLSSRLSFRLDCANKRNSPVKIDSILSSTVSLSLFFFFLFLNISTFFLTFSPPREWFDECEKYTI